MEGFTVILVDNKEPSEGDFVYVEAFDSADDLWDSLTAEPIESYTSPLSRALLKAARDIEARDA